MLQQRKQLRLKGWDYGQGWYFVTVCTLEKHEYLGIVEKDICTLSPAGMIVDRCIQTVTQHFPHVVIVEYVVMPNHLHIIMHIKHAVVDADLRPLQSATRICKTISPQQITKIFLSKVIHGIKSSSTRIANRNNRRLMWQRSFYDRIIRNEREYQELCAYIRNNPRNWYEDSLYAPK